jgi:hypothetical protein
VRSSREIPTPGVGVVVVVDCCCSSALFLSSFGCRHWLLGQPVPADRAILTWSRLHGVVILEIAGNYASVGIDRALCATRFADDTCLGAGGG